jgi:hypothetical protein
LVIIASVFVIRASYAHAERPDREDFASIRAWVESQPRTFENEVLFAVKDGQIVRSQYFTIPGEGFGDFDGDGDIDLFDYTAFQICLGFSGPGFTTPLPCFVFDSDADLDIDQIDMAAFQNAFTGSIGGVHVEAGSLFPAVASPVGYYSGEPGTSGSNALRGIARQAGYTQDDLWYEWTVIDQPIGSGAVIIANRSLSATPYLVLSPFVLGEYVFNLTVTNLFTGESGFDVTALHGVECLTNANCDDGDPCTTDACTDTSCSHTEVDCDDGLFCNGTEFCDSYDGSCFSYDEPCPLGTLCIENAETCEDELPVELIGQWGGPSEAVAVQGNYVYLGSGPRVLVFDVSDQSNPALVGRTDPLPGFVLGISVSGDFAYVADSDAGLAIINIADPSAPFRVGGVETSGRATGVAVSGSFAYVADRGAGLAIINIADPSAPYRVGGVDTSGGAYGVAVSGDYAYVADTNAGLAIINIADPSAPYRVGGVDTSGYAFGVALSGDYAYIANYTSLAIINIADPSAPYLVSGVDTILAYGVAVSGNYAYVADVGPGLAIINIADPSSPLRVGYVETNGTAHGVALSGDYAYVADGENGLETINIADPSAPYIVGGVDMPSGYPIGVAVSGNYAYLTDGGLFGADFAIINIADPAAPYRVGGVDTSGYNSGVALSGKYAYVANYKGLTIINIADPSAPFLVGGVDTSLDVLGVAVSGNYAYLTDAGAGLQIVNIADPAAPFRVGGVDTSGYAYGVALSGDYAYVADGGAGLVIINIANPSAPFWFSAVDTGGYAAGVAVSGDYAYLAGGWDGFQIINIADPSAPYRVGGVDTSGFAHRVAVSGDYAFVVDADDGLVIINIADPSSPFRVGGFDTSGYAWDIAVSEHYAYVADEDGGLAVFSVGMLPNDWCDGALPVWLGSRGYRNIGAATDGPAELSCPSPIGSDVWYTLTAPYTGTATASLCGSDFDTMIAVYSGTPCPPSAAPIVCVDDSECDGEGTVRSKVSFPVIGGEKYLLRIGGFGGDQGLGVMEVSMAP